VTLAQTLSPSPVCRLVVRSRPVPDPGPLLDLLPDDDVFSWVRNGEGVVGWGTAARCETSGPDRIASAEAWWSAVAAEAVVHDEVALPGSGLLAFGSFAFEEDSAATSSLVVPAVVVGHRGGRWWVSAVSPAGEPAGLPVVPTPSAARPPGDVVYADGSLTPLQWEQAVAAAIDRLADGPLGKVVLARDVEARTTDPVDPRWLLRRLGALYPSTWTFAVDGLVGATPELLVRLSRGLVTSRVLAGTIPRTGRDEHDLRNAASLARSSKDLDEHEFAVRSVAESLAPLCGSMNVPESPFVLHLPNVMHLATDVTGSLVKPATALGLVAALHPTAAVCGTPTSAARALIAELEGMDRGRYSGPVGWIDGSGDGEWGLALRCGQVDPNDARQMRLFAGCGIVAGSDPEVELAESVAKLMPMREALAGDV
jgi:menaquinone-specific isochorismate synthase